MNDSQPYEEAAREKRPLTSAPSQNDDPPTLPDKGEDLQGKCTICKVDTTGLDKW